MVARKGAAANAAPDPKPPFEMPAKRIAGAAKSRNKISISNKNTSIDYLKIKWLISINLYVIRCFSIHFIISSIEVR